MTDDAHHLERVSKLERRVDELHAALTDVWQQTQRLDEAIRTLAEHVDAVAAHSDGLSAHVADADARSWNEIAITRRLATLEDHVNTLLDQGETKH